MGGATQAAADERLQFSTIEAAANTGTPLDAGAVQGQYLAEGSTGSAKSSRPTWLLRSLAGVRNAARGALVMEWERGTGFLFLPVFMAAGAIAYYSVRDEPGFLSLILALVIFCASSVAAGDRPALRRTFVAATMALTGMVAAKAESWRAGTPITGSAVTTTVTGRVVGVEDRANGRVRLTLDVVETARPQLRYAPHRIRVTARRVPTGTEPGSIVTGVARLMPPSGPVRPGSYDFAFEGYFDRIGAIGFFLGDPALARTQAAASWSRRAAERLERARLSLAARVRNRIDGPEGEIAAALIAGVRSGIPEEINEALRRTGLAHILAISGLHMALVAGTVMVSIRMVLAAFPGVSARRPVKKYAAAVALVACALYLAMSGAAVAAQRSFIMLAVMLVALFFDRAALTLRNLAIAALVVLVIAPHEVVGPSFQMSFAATAALIGGYAAWSEYAGGKPKRPPIVEGAAIMIVRKLGYFAGGLAMTSIIAGLATTIYGVYHFNRVSPYALGANMLAMPLVTLLVMPSAVFAVVLMPFGLEGRVLDLMGWSIRTMNAIAAWFSERSPIDAVGSVPTLAVVVLTIALALATLLSTRLRLVSIPIALIGLGLVAERRLPDVLVSEDARLVAVRLADGRLALNRTRPNVFTLQDWMRALAAPGWTGPASSNNGIDDGGPDSFECGADYCLVVHQSGATVAFAETAGSASQFCRQASVIVIDDATAQDVCSDQESIVITKRDTARRGSAAVTFARRNGRARPQVRYSLAEPYRPWHEHRQFSREARGLAPYRREDADR